MNLWQKLLEIKKQVPYLRQDARSFGYDYASPEQVLGAFNKLYNEHGILVKSEVIEMQPERITVTTKSGDKQETLFTLAMEITLINAEKPEERETFRWAGAGVNGDEKGFGSALTYAERYFFLKQNNVPTGKDDPDAFSRKHEQASNGKYDKAQLEKYRKFAIEQTTNFSEAGKLNTEEKTEWLKKIMDAETSQAIVDFMNKSKKAKGIK